MSPCSCRNGKAVIAPPGPFDLHRLARRHAVLACDRRILAARRRHEAIAEALRAATAR